MYSAWKAARIIAVSESAKKDLMKYYRVPEGKIPVVYNGVDEILCSIETSHIDLAGVHPQTACCGG